MFHKLQLYVFRQCLQSLALTLAVIMAAIMLVDVVEQLRTVGSDTEISFLTAIWLSSMKLPMLIEHTMPFIILVGAILAYSRLSRLSELPAMRAAGLAAFLGLFTVTVLNPLGADLNSRYETTRASLVGSPVEGISAERNGVWLRQGSDTEQIVIHARSTGDAGVVLNDVKLFEYERVYTRGQGTDDFSFRRRIEADNATLKQGFWELTNVIENTPGLDPVRRDALSIPTDLDPAKLLDRFASPSTVSFWRLPEFISDTRRAGLDASRYEMQYKALLAAPILFVAMGIIGALVCLRLARLGGTGMLIAWGSFAAVMLYFITEITHSLGAAGATSMSVAAFTPPLFALFAALTAIAYLEDG